MPSALAMQVAFLSAANFCDNRASRDKDYEELVRRWQDKAERYLVQAAQLDSLVVPEVAA